MFRRSPGKQSLSILSNVIDLRGSLALLTFVLIAPSAQAGVTQTLGFGSAVESADRHANFDSLKEGSLLRGYTENGLIIDQVGPCDACWGYHYDGSREPTTISAADGQKLVALEFWAHSGSQAIWQSFFYWEAHGDGAIVGAGVFVAPAHSIVGFFDPEGFDDLQIMGYFTLAQAQAVAAVGFANASPMFRGMDIDNLVAEVAVDGDGDRRLGRFDNCPDVANPSQADADLDGVGDACDEFPNGGSALDQCLDELDALLRDPRLVDSDADGEADASDLCPATPAAAAVDEAGCSVHQFCGAIDPGSFLGRRTCALADWRNDEPLRSSRGDCRVVRGVCVAR
jgi:hypothetical protein